MRVCSTDESEAEATASHYDARHGQDMTRIMLGQPARIFAFCASNQLSLAAFASKILILSAGRFYTLTATSIF